MSSSNPPQQPPSFISKVKEGLSNIGHSLDASVSTVMKDLGQNIRVHCPGCDGEILAPPNEFVECPKCQHQFQSPTAAARTGQIVSELGKEAKGAVEPSSKDEPKRGAVEPSSKEEPKRGA